MWETQKFCNKVSSIGNDFSENTNIMSQAINMFAYCCTGMQ